MEFLHRYKRIISNTLFVGGFILLSLLSYTLYDLFIKPSEAIVAESSDTSSDVDYSDCTILGLNLHGALLTYIPEGNEDDPLTEKDITGSEEIVAALNAVKDDENIKGVLIEVDSPGGMPVAGEEIAKALKELGKPSAAVIRQSGMSAAYWAISTADRIFASRNSDVGSIGVTMSYLENVEKDKKYVQLSSGKYKDTGNPDKPLSEEEKSLLLRDIKIVHENFIEDIATNRGIPIEDVKIIADGSSVLGGKAKSLKLIDDIGGWTEAEKYLGEKIGEKPKVCW